MLQKHVFRAAAFMAIALTSFHAAGQCVSVQTGDWNQATTWSCEDPPQSRVPLCSDIPITIAENHTVKVSVQQDYTHCTNGLVLYIDGVLSFPSNGPKLRLPFGSFIAGSGTIESPGPGGGNSNLISIVNENGQDAPVWSTADGDTTGPFQFPIPHPLPIHLLTFNGHAGANAVHFSWTVASEVSNDYFAIERSADMSNWSVVHTQSGSGNSNQARTYQGQDASPENGLMYYRLSQTDFDGTREVFDPIAIEFRAGAGANQSPVLYPNPLDLSSQQPLFIHQEDGELDRITISDINGQAIQQIDYSDASSNPNKLEIDHQAFSQGMYFVRMEGAFGAKTAKLVVQ